MRLRIGPIHEQIIQTDFVEQIIWFIEKIQMKRMICLQVPQIHTQLIETDSVKQISWFFKKIQLKKNKQKKKLIDSLTRSDSSELLYLHVSIPGANEYFQ